MPTPPGSTVGRWPMPIRGVRTAAPGARSPTARSTPRPKTAACGDAARRPRREPPQRACCRNERPTPDCRVRLAATRSLRPDQRQQRATPDDMRHRDRCADPLVEADPQRTAVRRTHLPMFTDRHPTVGTAVLNGLGDSPSGGLPATRRGRRRDTPQAVQLQGGPAPQEIFDTHPSAQQADPDAVTSVLAAVTGFFLWQARLPAPPGLPSLRRFQDAQGRAALAWLRTRTGWR
jgi:hypothetical protein